MYTVPAIGWPVLCTTAFIGRSAISWASSWSHPAGGPGATASPGFGRIGIAQRSQSRRNHSLAWRKPPFPAGVYLYCTMEIPAAMAAHTLSILIPLYNEEEFVGTLLERVLSAPLPQGVGREIVVVDDGSTDGSAAIVEEIAAAHPGVLRFIRQPRNRGKGAAIRTAIEYATGEFSIIQDADLEYDPREYGRLLAPLLEGKADAVYGSRFVISGERRVLYFWHSVANQILTGMCNIVLDLNLTDMETCYKAFRTSLLQSIPIRSDRFGLEPELTIKLGQAPRARLRNAHRLSRPDLRRRQEDRTEGRLRSRLCDPALFAHQRPLQRFRTGYPGRARRGPAFQSLDGRRHPALHREAGAGDRSGHRQPDPHSVSAARTLYRGRHRS